MKYGGKVKDQLKQMQQSFNFGNTLEIPKGYAVTSVIHDEIIMEQCDDAALPDCCRCPCGHRGHFWSAWFELAFCSEKCYDAYVEKNGDGGTANAETKTNPV